jgi:hypothetical protein
VRWCEAGARSEQSCSWAFGKPDADENKKGNIHMRTLLIAIVLVVALSVMQAGEPRKEKRERSHNYIIERQQAYQVQGVPTSRMIIGKREVDIYPNGLMFERNNVVGVQGR